MSRTRTPNRLDLSPAWTGETVSGGAAIIQWSRNTRHLDVNGNYRDIAEGFRGDAGFIPQTGYRETGGGVGWTVRPTGFVSRHRTFANASRQVDRTGALISRMTSVGMGMDTRLNGFFELRYHDDEVRSGAAILHARRFGFVAQSNPSRRITAIGLDGVVGEDVDFANSRLGRGGTVNMVATVNPTDHVEFALLENVRWLNVNDGDARGRLLTARVSRLRGTYTFTARSFARLIAQYVSTERDPSLFLSTVSPRSGTFLASLLFAYKLNWQSVLFIGYGDDRELSTEERLERSGRQVFVKISYAIQR